MKLAVVAVAAVCAGPAHAYFERPLVSTRTASLGGAFVALADDASAVVDNPAGLTGLPTLSLLATYQRPFGVEGLDEGCLAVSIPARVATVGASWFHRGLDGALSEDLLTLALARDVKRTSEDASLSVGVGVDLARVDAGDGIDRAASVVGVGAAVLLRPFAFIGVGYSVRNLNEPTLDLIDGGTGTVLPRTHEVGLSYYWQERVVITFETGNDGAGAWRGRGGVELRAAPGVVLRGGLERSHAAAGVGLTWRTVTLDLGMTSHDALGASYLVSLRLVRPVDRSPYGAR